MVHHGFMGPTIMRNGLWLSSVLVHGGEEVMSVDGELVGS